MNSENKVNSNFDSYPGNLRYCRPWHRAWTARSLDSSYGIHLQWLSGRRTSVSKGEPRTRKPRHWNASLVFEDETSSSTNHGPWPINPIEVLASFSSWALDPWIGLQRLSFIYSLCFQFFVRSTVNVLYEYDLLYIVIYLFCSISFPMKFSLFIVPSIITFKTFWYVNRFLINSIPFSLQFSLFALSYTSFFL